MYSYILSVRKIYNNRVKNYHINSSPAECLAPAVTVGETEGAMDPASVLFLPPLLPITL